MKNLSDTRKVRPTDIIVHNASSEEIPSNSFARIIGYDKSNQYFNVDKPDESGIIPNFVVVIPWKIPAGENGIGIIDGVAVVKKDSAVSVAAGDTVGTTEDAWTASGSPGFAVLDVDGNYVIIRRGVAGRVYAKITATLQREDPVALPPLPAIDRYKIAIIGVPPPPIPLEAWVFGFAAEDYPSTPSLLDTDKWYQVDDEVEVVEYHDARWPARKWWIMGTVSRIVAGTGADIKCSLYWFQKIDGVRVARRGSVYR
jgi:hypothetical protein